MNLLIERLAPLAVTLVAAPLLPGIINKVKAAIEGRQGPPVLQLYYDLLKLLRKGAVYSTTTTWIFRAGPVVALAAFLAAALFVPLRGSVSVVSFAGDAVLFAYLLGLARFFTVLAALDTGSSFEGMGASREVTFALLAEPTLFIGLVVLARQTGSLSLSTMVGGAAGSLDQVLGGSLALIALSLFVVCLAENSRIPVDDPATHLELTMIHEVMVLDHSGPDLAFILYGASLKLFLMVSILAHLILPMNLGMPAVEWALFAGIVGAITLAIGLVESSMARLRLNRVPRLLMAACVMAIFGMILSLR